MAAFAHDDDPDSGRLVPRCSDGAAGRRGMAAGLASVLLHAAIAALLLAPAAEPPTPSPPPVIVDLIAAPDAPTEPAPPDTVPLPDGSLEPIPDATSSNTSQGWGGEVEREPSREVASQADATQRHPVPTEQAPTGLEAEPQPPELSVAPARGDVAPIASDPTPLSPVSLSPVPPPPQRKPKPRFRADAPAAPRLAETGAPKPPVARNISPDPPKATGEVLAAPVNPAPSLTAYTSAVSGRLERYKTYPRMARIQRQEGTVVISFTMAREGRVVSCAIRTGSGYPSLDEEACALVKRASPLPPPPSPMLNDSLELTVPIRFSIQ